MSAPALTSSRASNLRAQASAFGWLRPYAFLIRLGFVETMRNKSVAIGRVLFLGVLLLIFSSLWRALADQGSLGGIASGDFVWYLALTEWTALALPHMHLSMERDMRSGDFACQLPRPVSYAWAQVCENIGIMLARQILLFIFGVPLAWLIAGGWPSNPAQLWMAIPLGLLSGVVTVISIAWIGLLSALIQDADAPYWLWQKLSFLLGGLLIPLTIYPSWVETIASFTPFYVMLFGVGRHALEGASTELALLTLGQIALWGVGLALVTQWVYGRILRATAVNGG